jgi:5-methylcytosine-specific restriction endonuclease McrA
MSLTARQIIYLHHAFILRKTKKQILEETDLKEEEFKNWWVELRAERERLKPIRDFWIRKKCEGLIDFHVFEAQLLNRNKHCHYCNLTEKEIEKLWKIEADKGFLLTKRGRGYKLELERIEPEAPYDQLENLVFACYWCNNAKTDTFTGDEFKKVGKIFREIWNDRLK